MPLAGGHRARRCRPAATTSASFIAQYPPQRQVRLVAATRTHRSREERQVNTSQGAAQRARDAKTKRTERRCCRGIVAWRPHRQPQRRLTQRAAALQLQWQHRNVGQHHEVEEMEEYLGNASRTFVPRYVGQRPAAVHLHLDSIAAYFHGIHHRCNTTINGDLQRHRVCPSTPPRNASEATHAQHMHT